MGKINQKNIIFLVFLFLIIAVVFYFFSNSTEVKNITAEEAKKNLENNSEIILLDVRTVEEYKEIKIPGSILIPLNLLQEKIENEIPDKNKTIYVYCRTGSRSTSAVKILNKLGYENVFNLGGIYDWPYDTN